ncbi:MAG: hypothetical protein ACH254_20770 [Candidatus Thiodiazotropha endolucinida]
MCWWPDDDRDSAPLSEDRRQIDLRRQPSGIVRSGFNEQHGLRITQAFHKVYRRACAALEVGHPESATLPDEWAIIKMPKI